MPTEEEVMLEFHRRTDIRTLQLQDSWADEVARLYLKDACIAEDLLAASKYSSEVIVSTADLAQIELISDD